MLKDALLVGFGSFLGGSARYVVSKLLPLWMASPFPIATFAVNIIGCFIIGLLTALPTEGWLSTNTKLILTTGFCGGFTTFSTFMNENNALIKDGNIMMAAFYIILSLALGFAAVIMGIQLAKAI